MAVLLNDGVLLHYTREVENKVRSNSSRQAHCFNVCEKVVHFWRKESSYGGVVSDVNYEKQDNVLTRHSGWTNEMEETPRRSATKNIYITVTGENRRNGVGWFVRSINISFGFSTSFTSFPNLVSS